MTSSDLSARLRDSTFLIGTIRRRATIRALAASADPSDVVFLGEALAEGHPDAEIIARRLERLSIQTQGEHVLRLWDLLLESPTARLASILAQLGWPPDQPISPVRRRGTLSVAKPDSEPELMRAVICFARALPVDDEATNDDLFGTWIRLRSPALQQLILEQHRRPGSLALEALLALVCADLGRYSGLNDADGALFLQAWHLAPDEFRARITSTVAGSSDLRIRDAFRRALVGSAVDISHSIENLKRIGDEDGLFEMTRYLRLRDVLEFCERWASTGTRPSAQRSRAAVERALVAFARLGHFEVDPGPQLPEGLVDIFDWWRSQKPTDAQLAADLDHPNPFRTARSLYMGIERGLVDEARLCAAAVSDHWPERLMAQLIDPSLLKSAKDDHVFWVSACAGDASILSSSIGGTPDDYRRNIALLRHARGPDATRTSALLEIMCAFQGAFVDGSIVFNDSTEADDDGAVEIEDAPHLDF